VALEPDRRATACGQAMIDLTRYLVRLILVRLAMVLLGVVALGLTFDLLQSGPALVASEPGTLGPIRYSLLRLPILASDLLPVAALLGGILAAGDLLRRGELVAIWNLGMSGLQLSRRLIPAGLLLAVIQYVFDDVARPLAVEELRAGRPARSRPASPGCPQVARSGCGAATISCA